jgi:pteridine reductase
MLSKKTLFELTKMSARELAPHIRVNAIAPGIILPPDVVDREKFERDSTKNPLHQKASPSDVCRALEYLVRSQHVTGECLFVDGGDHVAC